MGKKYKPVYILETYGESFEFAKRQNPKNIWTVVISETGQECIMAGWHFVNRENYVLTEAEWVDGTDQDYVVLKEESNKTECEICGANSNKLNYYTCERCAEIICKNCVGKEATTDEGWMGIRWALCIECMDD